MHAARLASSPRLQRVLRLLQDGQAHSTMDINIRARVCVAGTAVSELRHNGAEIACSYQGKADDGSRIYVYRLIASPAGWDGGAGGAV